MAPAPLPVLVSPMELSLVWSWVFKEPNPKMKRSKFLKITAAGGVFIIFWPLERCFSKK